MQLTDLIKRLCEEIQRRGDANVRFCGIDPDCDAHWNVFDDFKIEAVGDSAKRLFLVGKEAQDA